MVGDKRKAMKPPRYINHSYKAISIAMKYGWQPGARYTNLRDIRRYDRIGFMDIDWKNYSFAKHLAAVQLVHPKLTVARDIIDIKNIDAVLEEAEMLSQFCENVIIVPKDKRLSFIMESLIPKKFILGYSVPTKYGGTQIPPNCFKRPVHLLGGRPDVQRKLANEMEVASFDCNRFTFDAAYGDYFDGETFRPHPTGGYASCIEDSIKNINMLWANY